MTRITTLQDDLLQEFHEDRKMLDAQIVAFDPLAAQLRKPAAVRVASASGLVLLEVLCYLMFVGSVLLVVFMNRLYPFYLVTQLRDKPAARDVLSETQAQHLNWLVGSLVLCTGLLFIFLARALSRIRLKNGILSLAGRDIKALVGQHLQRKSALNALAQRHNLEVTPTPATELVEDRVNDVENPGY